MGSITYVIDGRTFSSLEEFYEVLGDAIIPGVAWGQNLDALNDILRGGFGTPPQGFRIHWTYSGVSRLRLGHTETVRQLERRLQRCHPSNRPAVAEQLALARAGKGPTVFDWLIEIFASHGPSGQNPQSRVDLVLE
jgi:RNAse (barnase) inhibitor barstar